MMRSGSVNSVQVSGGALIGLLGGPNGAVRAELEPVFQCLHQKRVGGEGLCPNRADPGGLWRHLRDVAPDAADCGVSVLAKVHGGAGLLTLVRPLGEELICICGG